jgi:hypothetical protein
MARGNTYICATCGKAYEFCLKCQITKPSFDVERYCTAAHQDIFNILSKHGCHLATAEETLEALKGYDTTNVTESIKAHIDSLQPKKVEVEDKAEAKAEAEKAVETKSKKFSFRTQE